MQKVLMPLFSNKPKFHKNERELVRRYSDGESSIMHEDICHIYRGEGKRGFADNYKIKEREIRIKVGEPLTHMNCPSNWLEQTENLCKKIRDMYGVCYRGFHKESVSLMDNRIVLSDYFALNGKVQYGGRQFFSGSLYEYMRREVLTKKMWGAQGMVLIDYSDGSVTKYYLKGHTDKLDRETGCLLKLEKRRGFPKVLEIGTDYFVMSYAGEVINPHNCPDDWEGQLDRLLDHLDSEGIVHGDPRKENITVKDGQLLLIDFAYSYVDPNQTNKNEAFRGKIHKLLRKANKVAQESK
jgi:predicted Ser/Thr protein kinase